jgi:hypothetical protein
MAPGYTPAASTRMLSLRRAGGGDGAALHAGSPVKDVVVAPRGRCGDGAALRADSPDVDVFMATRGSRGGVGLHAGFVVTGFIAACRSRDDARLHADSSDTVVANSVRHRVICMRMGKREREKERKRESTIVLTVGNHRLLLHGCSRVLPIGVLRLVAVYGLVRAMDGKF